MAKKYPFMSYIPPEMPLRKRELRCSTRDEWKPVVQELAQRYTKQYNNREGRELLDINGPMLKRRTEAVLDRIDEVYRRYSDLLDCFPDDRSFGEEWIWLNLPHQTYTYVEGESSLLRSDNACISCFRRTTASTMKCTGRTSGTASMTIT